jgi:predicted DNA-binding WGR domain protein
LTSQEDTSALGFQVTGIGLLRLTSVDPSINRHRQYEIVLVRSLFGEWGVQRAWGPVGTPGSGSATDWFDTEAEAVSYAAKILSAKMRRGYALNEPLGQRVSQRRSSR